MDSGHIGSEVLRYLFDKLSDEEINELERLFVSDDEYWDIFMRLNSLSLMLHMGKEEIGEVCPELYDILDEFDPHV